jgi:hypothetical protein
MRLPPQILAQATPAQVAVRISRNPGRTFDIGAAGPEWRFLTHYAPEAEWCRAAYDYAGALLTPADTAR